MRRGGRRGEKKEKKTIPGGGGGRSRKACGSGGGELRVTIYRVSVQEGKMASVVVTTGREKTCKIGKSKKRKTAKDTLHHARGRGDVHWHGGKMKKKKKGEKSCVTWKKKNNKKRNMAGKKKKIMVWHIQKGGEDLIGNGGSVNRNQEEKKGS